MSSGLPPNIVEQLMDAERIPVKNMETKKVRQEDLLKLVTDLESKVGGINANLADLVSARGFSDTKLVSGDPSIIDGTVDSNVAPTGDYSIEVLQLAQKPGAVSNGFPDRNETQVGVGYIKFGTPEGVREVYINSENSTLEGIAKQINSSGFGLRATVLEDRKDKENPFKLLVTGLETGDDEQVSFPTIYMLDGDQDLYFDESRKAQNAKIKVDGFELEVPSNQVGDIIPGVNLELKQAAPGREVRVFVKENLEAINEKMKKFIEAYNGALSFIQNQHKLQKGANGKESLGPLGGDSLIRSIESTLRRVVQSPQMGVPSHVKTLNELGVEFNRNGTLNFNQDKFTARLNQDPKGVAAFFRGDGFQTGFIPTVKREVTNMTVSGFGPIGNRKRGIQQKIDRLNEQIGNKERQLERREESLRKKFSDLESKMSQIQNQGNSFAAMTQGNKS